MPNPSFSRVKEVFEQWAMYDAVVQADYMAHKELVAALAEWSRQQDDAAANRRSRMRRRLARDACVSGRERRTVSRSGCLGFGGRARARARGCDLAGQSGGDGRQSGRLSARPARRLSDCHSCQLFAASFFVGREDRAHQRMSPRARARRHVFLDRPSLPRRANRAMPTSIA